MIKVIRANNGIKRLKNRIITSDDGSIKNEAIPATPKINPKGRANPFVKRISNTSNRNTPLWRKEINISRSINMNGLFRIVLT